jgi:hypothetical protein
MSKNFTAKQKEIVARKLGYDGPMQGFDEFLQSSPALAMKYGMVADKYMAKGGMVKKYQAGGLTLPSDVGSYTPEQKADLYNQYISQGYSDADIRTAAGQQTDENWSMLQQIANTRKAGVANVTMTSPNQTEAAATREQVLAAYRNNPLATLNPDEAAINYWMSTGLSNFDQVVKDVRVANPTLAAQIDAERKSSGTTATAAPAVVTNQDVEEANLFNAARQQGVNLPSNWFSLSGTEKANWLSQNNVSSTAIANVAGSEGLAALVSAGYIDRTRAAPASSGATREQVLAAYRNNPLAVLNPDEEAISYWMRTGLSTFDQAVKDVRAANPTLAKQIDQQRAALAIASDPQAAALAAAREGIAKGMTNQQIADMVNSKYGKSFSAQNIADFISNNNIADTRQKPKTTTTTADTTVSTGGGTPGQQYTDVGRPIAGAVSQVTAAQTEFTPEMKLDAQKYVAGEAPTAAVTTAQAAPAVTVPAAVKPTQVTAAQTQQAVQQALAPLTAAQGQAPTIEAAQLTAEQKQAAMAQAQQLDQAQKVQQAQRTLQAGELVAGTTVDQQRVEQAIAQTQAAQGKVTEEMTVQGQLAKLTANFDTRNPPPWAAGAVRAATAVLAARGLGASSMAGQAIIQATFESAIPIASADAAAYQQMEAQNLSNRQQVAVLAAQQRAQFLGQEFDQSFQTRVLNAAKIADIANMNFTAQQQVYLENARLAQSVDLANLSNRQATVMANAATIANMETANLNARQQAAVANAQNFLQMSIANMNNQQQVALFKAQELTQSILSDAAAENAARQFNATSQLQADQFNAQITTQVSQFNAAQKNAMEQFNAGQTNAMSQFNAQMKSQREEFNVKNRTIIDQANAQLLAQISLSNTAALNAGNFENARAMNNMTMSQYNNEVQLYRDQIKMVFDSYERAEDRAASMATAVLQANLAREKMDADTSASFAKLVGSLVTGTKLGDKIIDAGTDFLKNLFRP